MDPMNWALLIGLVIVALVLGGAIAWYVLRRRQTHLRDRFGPEYDHVVEATGDRRQAESELLRREERVKKFDIRNLSSEERSRYAEDWRKVQARFVDTPALAVAEADELVTDLMRARGYPMVDFEQRAADVSVDHPQVIEHYRAAHSLAIRSERGTVDTEDLRQAMVHYRALFEDLLEAPVRDGRTRPTREEVRQ